jgi:hypothetical protein
MKRLFSLDRALAAAIVFGALGAASAAHARADVFVSIGVQPSYGYVQPAPVYVQPAPVYVQPAPVYVQPRPVYVQPAPVYVQPQVVYGSYRAHDRRWAWGDSDRDGVPNIRDRDSRFYDHGAAHRAGGRGDADRDGVPNRYDRAPQNPYRH